MRSFSEHLERIESLYRFRLLETQWPHEGITTYSCSLPPAEFTGLGQQCRTCFTRRSFHSLASLLLQEVNRLRRRAAYTAICYCDYLERWVIPLLMPGQQYRLHSVGQFLCSGHHNTLRTLYQLGVSRIYTLANISPRRYLGDQPERDPRTLFTLSTSANRSPPDSAAPFHLNIS